MRNFDDEILLLFLIHMFESLDGPHLLIHASYIL